MKFGQQKNCKNCWSLDSSTLLLSNFSNKNPEYTISIENSLKLLIFMRIWIEDYSRIVSRSIFFSLKPIDFEFLNPANLFA